MGLNDPLFTKWRFNMPRTTPQQICLRVNDFFSKVNDLDSLDDNPQRQIEHISDVINNGFCFIYALLVKDCYLATSPVNKNLSIISAGSHTFTRLITDDGDTYFFDSFITWGEPDPLAISCAAHFESLWFIHSDFKSIVERYQVDYFIDQLHKLLAVKTDDVFIEKCLNDYLTETYLLIKERKHG